MEGPLQKPRIIAINPAIIIQSIAGHLTCQGMVTRPPDQHVLSRGLSRHRSLDGVGGRGETARGMVSRESSEYRPSRPRPGGQRERHDMMKGHLPGLSVCQPRRLDDVLTGL